MISEETPERLCYFEVDDLNVDQPISLVDVVMLMNRMKDVRVHLQARLINEREKIQYVAHQQGVQIVGKIPQYMRQVTLKKAKPSQYKTGHKSEKIHRYVIIFEIIFDSSKHDFKKKKRLEMYLKLFLIVIS